jgi:acyl-CoA thioester hydrolase
LNADPFILELEVRDYECDIEGIVNNAVYLNYLEHARHVFLKGKGIDFAALARGGVHLVVLRAELDYLAPLRSGDRFTVSVRVERVSPLRVAFLQEIRASPGDRPVLKAKVVGTALNERGRPFLLKELERLWEDEL